MSAGLSLFDIWKFRLRLDCKRYLKTVIGNILPFEYNYSEFMLFILRSSKTVIFEEIRSG